MMDYAMLISNVGFPIAITFYLLFRLEKTLDRNTRAILELTKRWK